MNLRDLQLADWRQFSDADAMAYVKQVVANLPHPVRLVNIFKAEYAGQTHRIAYFNYNQALFALIPGHEVQLGYDVNRFQSSSEQLESYQASAEEYEIADDIYGFVDDMTRGPRMVTIAPMLLEVQAQEIGIERTFPNDPTLSELLAKYANHLDELHNQQLGQPNPDGTLEAWRTVGKTHPEIVQELAQDGLRLPTADEWEYACGAGSRTLFRWGDDCPCDRYPTDNTVDEIRRKREWVLSLGKIPFAPDQADWDLHLQPNLFGLLMAQNPYNWEIVAERGVMRGGDGGGSICGGASYFLGWLPLATAYWDENVNQELADYHDLSEIGSFMRRVIPCV